MRKTVWFQPTSFALFFPLPSIRSLVTFSSSSLLSSLPIPPFISLSLSPLFSPYSLSLSHVSLSLPPPFLSLICLSTLMISLSFISLTLSVFFFLPSLSLQFFNSTQFSHERQRGKLAYNKHHIGIQLAPEHYLAWRLPVFLCHEITQIDSQLLCIMHTRRQFFHNNKIFPILQRNFY